jgi:hypothetical protein
VDALARLRLVNRSNLGVGRMFEALLIEGKEQPLIVEPTGHCIPSSIGGCLSPATRNVTAV